MTDFNCLRCGNCCRNIVGNNPVGLYLNTEEVKYFPKESYVPLFKFRERITAYQLILNVCPHYSVVDGLATCGIYVHRPLGCKAFPLKGIFEIDFTLCKFTMINKNKKWNFDSFNDERVALLQQMEEIKVTPQATSMYLFKQDKWI